MSITSDGSTASYYELPEDAKELQHLISHRDMNAQIGEIFRACYRYGKASHSSRMRDAKKIRFYIEAEIARLEALSDQSQVQADNDPLACSGCVSGCFRCRTDQSQPNTGKPSWDDMPEWAMWMAQSEHGAWECYEDKPMPMASWWNHELRGRREGYGKQNPSWRNTLEPRPIPPEELEWQTAPDQATHLLMNGKQRKFAMQDGDVMRECDTQYVIDVKLWPIIVGR